MNNNDLERLENLIVVAYSSNDPNERGTATSAINKFTQLDYWKHNLMIMSQSKNPFALHFASLNLRNALTDFTTSFSPEDKIELRKVMLTVLADLGGQFWGNTTVKPMLVECFCRLQKLCWFDTDPTANLISDIIPFLQHSLAHSIIGINLLQQLVYELSQTTEKFPYSKQRKISVVFREKCLKEIFQLGLTSLKRILQSDRNASEITQTQQSLLTKESLELITQILAYDFIGVAPDPSTSDDVGVIHVPEAWATLIEDKDTLLLFFKIYDEFGSPHSTQCLVVLESMAGIRNSLFTSSETRAAFLNTLVDGVGNILTTKKDLEHEQNRHQLCRLLVRLKGNYQLRHLLETKNYTAFVHKLVEFSISLFQSTSSFNTVYYILNFWSHIVGAHCLLKTEKSQPTLLNEVAPTIINGFIMAEIEHAAQPPTTIEDFLESEHLQSVLGELPGIARCGYTGICMMLLNGLRSIVQHRFQPILKLPNSDPSIIVAEKQITWMIYISASIIGGLMRGVVFENEQSKNDVQQIEGQIICSIFECLSLHDRRIQEHGPTKATPLLELAFIMFLQKFCRVYLGDTAMSSAAIIYEMLAQQLNLGVPDRVIDRIVTKVIMLLKLWPQHVEIVDQTTGPDGLFWHLATGFAASKLMGKSPLVSHMLEHHLELDVGGSRRPREAFYKTLSCLLFSVNNKSTDFYAFITPIKQRVDQIKSILLTSSVQKEQGRRALTQVLSDLRGFVSAIYSKDRGYLVFFDWFYHETGYYEWLVQLLSQVQQLNFQNEDVWSIILFADEFANNTRRRIAFPVTSADGIRLFRTTAHLLIHFAKFIMSPQHSSDIDDKYKSIKIFLRCLERCLIGGYTNFGVFEMYNDSILNDLLTISCTILFSLEPVHLDLYPKVFALVFSVTENLSKDHCEFLINMDTNLFGQVLKLLLLGLHSKVKSVISSSCTSLDRLFTLHATNLLSAQQNRFFSRTLAHKQLECMSAHVATHQNLINSILIQLINLTITIDGVHWFVCKPLLALIILSQKEFNIIQQLIVSSQAQEEAKAKKVAEICLHLMDGIAVNLNSDNREKFTANITTFRTELKNIIDLNAFYKAVVSYTKE